MRAGWKNRIDERRYFEEKQEKKREKVIRQMLADIEIEAMRRKIERQKPPFNPVTFDFKNPMDVIE